MNERISSLRQAIVNREHLAYRRRIEFKWGDEFEALNLSNLERSVQRIIRLLQAEQPLILPDERIVYTRY